MLKDSNLISGIILFAGAIGASGVAYERYYKPSWEGPKGLYTISDSARAVHALRCEDRREAARQGAYLAQTLPGKNGSTAFRIVNDNPSAHTTLSPTLGCAFKVMGVTVSGANFEVYISPTLGSNDGWEVHYIGEFKPQ
jgi:hypothetical protein